MITQTRKTPHHTFGGLISNADFRTDFGESKNIASKIISDWKFDEQCKNDAKLRSFSKKDGEEQ